MARAPEVDAWFDSFEHHAKNAMLRLRQIILSEPRVEETIKWKSPINYKGNMASVSIRVVRSAGVAPWGPSLATDGPSSRHQRRQASERAHDVRRPAQESGARALVTSSCPAERDVTGLIGERGRAASTLVHC